MNIPSLRPSSRIGLALALVVALIALLVPVSPISANTFTVSTTADSGPGSLRAAIESANLTSAKDTIKFAIPGAGPHTIVLASDLPGITRPVIIDGTTQPTVPLTLGVVIDGISAVNGLFLTTGSTGSTIKGLAIINCGSSGILVDGSGSHIIQGNYIGTADGVTAAGNSIGIFLSNSPNNLIGGTTASQGNLVAASAVGIHITGTSSTGNRVQGNRIGTDSSGTMALGNSTGVQIVDASGSTIGGTAAGARNIISGSINEGIVFNGLAAQNNVIQGNYIGTDATGTLAIANGTGVTINSPNNTIGGTTAAERNVISGNGGYGIDLSSDADNTIVVGNYIGTDAAGTSALGNTDGINVATSFNTIGSSISGGGNVISGNTSNGIAMSGTNNTVQGNFIGTDVTSALVLGNGSHGIVVSGSDHTIGGAASGAGNQILYHYAGTGVVLTGASNTAVQGNTVHDSLDGIVLTNGTSSITIGGAAPNAGNDITSSDNVGVKIEDGSSLATLQGNRILTNGEGIALLDTSVITTNTMNCIASNGGGMTNSTAVSTTAVDNWWGSASGPTHASNPGGTGNTVSDDVVFVPFVTTSCDILLGERVTNGDMEDATGGLPDGWVGSKLVLGTQDGQECDPGFYHSDFCSFRIAGNGKSKTLTQTINVSGGAGEDITLSLYSLHMIPSLPGSGAWNAKVTITYTDGTTQSSSINLPINEPGSWTLSSAPTFTTTKAYNKIVVVITYAKGSGTTVWIDDVSVLAVP
jgi:parallel beta-helix repeat protein